MPIPEEQIAAAAAYEALHVPALFQQWTEHMLDAAGVRSGDRVLDVACGTGVLVRAAAERIGAEGVAAGLDSNPGMLAVAGRLAPAVDLRQGTAENLPFADQTFDAVVSQFGIMFFSDRVQAVREMVRVLVPGGRLAVAVWAALEETPAYQIEVALLERLAGPRAADALRAPSVLGDRGELAALFEEAGVASPVIAARSGTARFPSIRTMVEADLRGWLPVMGVVLEEDLIQQILAEAESALSRYVTAAGQVVFEVPALIVTATKPKAFR